MTNFCTRPLDNNDQQWVSQFIARRWGSDIIVVHGVTYQPSTLPGFAAVQEGEIVGLITYQIEEKDCGIVSLDSLRESQGIGTALMEAVKKVALEAGCCRIWLITTNDNLHALRFYQKRGFVLVAVHRGAVTASRKIKPEIPLMGADGIPIRDEIELERDLP